MSKQMQCPPPKYSTDPKLDYLLSSGRSSRFRETTDTEECDPMRNNGYRSDRTYRSNGQYDSSFRLNMDAQTINALSSLREKACRFLRSDVDDMGTDYSDYRPSYSYESQRGNDRANYLRRARDIDYVPESEFLKKMKQQCQFLQDNQPNVFSYLDDPYYNEKPEYQKYSEKSYKSSRMEDQSDRYPVDYCLSNGSFEITYDDDMYRSTTYTKSGGEGEKLAAGDDKCNCEKCEKLKGLLEEVKTEHISRSKKRDTERHERKRKPELRGELGKPESEQFEPNLKRPHADSCERCWKYASPSRSPVNKPDQKYDPNFRRGHSCMTLNKGEDIDAFGKHINPCKNVQPVSRENEERAGPPPVTRPKSSPAQPTSQRHTQSAPQQYFKAKSEAGQYPSSSFDQQTYSMVPPSSEQYTASLTQSNLAHKYAPTPPPQQYYAQKYASVPSQLPPQQYRCAQKYASTPASPPPPQQYIPEQFSTIPPPSQQYFSDKHLCIPPPSQQYSPSILPSSQQYKSAYHPSSPPYKSTFPPSLQPYGSSMPPASQPYGSSMPPSHPYGPPMPPSSHPYGPPMPPSSHPYGSSMPPSSQPYGSSMPSQQQAYKSSSVPQPSPEKVCPPKSAQTPLKKTPQSEKYSPSKPSPKNASKRQDFPSKSPEKSAVRPQTVAVESSNRNNTRGMIYSDPGPRPKSCTPGMSNRNLRRFSGVEDLDATEYITVKARPKEQTFGNVSSGSRGSKSSPGSGEAQYSKSFSNRSPGGGTLKTIPEGESSSRSKTPSAKSKNGGSSKSSSRKSGKSPQRRASPKTDSTTSKSSTKTPSKACVKKSKSKSPSPHPTARTKSPKSPKKSPTKDKSPSKKGAKTYSEGEEPPPPPYPEPQGPTCPNPDDYYQFLGEPVRTVNQQYDSPHAIRECACPPRLPQCCGGNDPEDHIFCCHCDWEMNLKNQPVENPPGGTKSSRVDREGQSYDFLPRNEPFRGRDVSFQGRTAVCPYRRYTNKFGGVPEPQMSIAGNPPKNLKEYQMQSNAYDGSPLADCIAPRKYTVMYMTDIKERKGDDVEVLVEELTQACTGESDKRTRELTEKMKKIMECPADSMALRFQKGVTETSRTPRSSRTLYF